MGTYADVVWQGGNEVEEEMEYEEAVVSDYMNGGDLVHDVDVEFERKFEAASFKLLKRVVDLEQEVKMLKSSAGASVEELDRKKYKRLVAEYRKYKAKNVRHFKFNSTATSPSFSKSYFIKT